MKKLIVGLMWVSGAALNTAEAGVPQVFQCTGATEKESATLTILTVEGTPGHYLDSLNQGRWKLERPGQDAQLMTVRYVMPGRDKPVIPIGAPQYQCGKDERKIHIFLNVAQDTCTDCSGPGRSVQYELLNIETLKPAGK